MIPGSPAPWRNCRGYSKAIEIEALYREDIVQQCTALYHAETHFVSPASGIPDSTSDISDVTHILTAIEQGDTNAADKLLPLVYEELRKLAAHRDGERSGGSYTPA